MYRPTEEKCPGVDSVATRILFGRVVICTRDGEEFRGRLKVFDMGCPTFCPMSRPCRTSELAFRMTVTANLKGYYLNLLYKFHAA